MLLEIDRDLGINVVQVPPIQKSSAVEKYLDINLTPDPYRMLLRNMQIAAITPKVERKRAAPRPAPKVEAKREIPRPRIAMEDRVEYSSFEGSFTQEQLNYEPVLNFQGDDMSNFAIGKTIDPIKNIPDKASTSEQWVAWYKVLVGLFGKKSAEYAFVMAWQKRGGTGSSASVNDIERGTGLKLDKSFIDSVLKVGEDGLGFFKGVTDFIKYAIIGTTVIIGVLLLGLVIKLLSSSAADIGTVVGVAAKTAV